MARWAPSGPFSSRPGPWRGPPLGCVPAPRPPFVQWVHTALLWPGVWPGGSLISQAQAERAWGHLYWAPLPPGLQTSVQSPLCCLPTWHACVHTGTRVHMSRLSHSPAQGGLQPQGHCPCTPDGATPHGPGLGPVGGVCLRGLPNIWQKPLRDGSPALPQFLEAGDGRKKRRCTPHSLDPVWGSSTCVWRTSQKACSACLDGLPLHSFWRPRPAELSQWHFPRSGPHGQGLPSAVDACVLPREIRVTEMPAAG